MVAKRLPPVAPPKKYRAWHRKLRACGDHALGTLEIFQRPWPHIPGTWLRKIVTCACHFPNGRQPFSSASKLAAHTGGRRFPGTHGQCRFAHHMGPAPAFLRRLQVCLLRLVVAKYYDRARLWVLLWVGVFLVFLVFRLGFFVCVFRNPSHII